MSEPSPAHSRSFGFSSRILLALVALCFVAAVAGYVGYGRWQESKHPHLKVHGVLYRSVRHGDSIEKVQGLLPGFRVATPDETVMWDRLSKFGPRPDGFEPGDRVLIYDLPEIRAKINLQFREGKLINFDHKDYYRWEDPRIDAAGG